MQGIGTTMRYRNRNDLTDSGGCAGIVHTQLPSSLQPSWAASRIKFSNDRANLQITLIAAKVKGLTTVKGIQTVLPNTKLVASCCSSPGGHM